MEREGTPEEQLNKSYEEINSSIQSELLDRVLSQTPEFFEELVVKLLQAMGYGDDDIVFWTEGISLDDWGGKEFIYVITMENSQISGIHQKQLDPRPTRGDARYKKSMFFKYPNKNCGYNDFVRGLLTYVSYGTSGSTSVRYLITYNKYKRRVKINEESSAVFLVPQSCN